MPSHRSAPRKVRVCQRPWGAKPRRRWPRVLYSTVGVPISRNWIALDDGERRLPDKAAALRLEFEGETGSPIELFMGGEIDYPKNFRRAA